MIFIIVIVNDFDFFETRTEWPETLSGYLSTHHFCFHETDVVYKAMSSVLWMHEKVFDFVSPCVFLQAAIEVVFSDVNREGGAKGMAGNDANVLEDCTVEIEKFFGERSYLLRPWTTMRRREDPVVVNLIIKTVVLVSS